MWAYKLSRAWFAIEDVIVITTNAVTQIEGLVPDYSVSSALVMEILQSRTNN